MSDDAAHNVETGAKGASWLARAVHLAEGAGHMSKALHIGGAFGKAMPGIGAGLSLLSGGMNLGLAVHNFQKEGYHSDKAWNNVGGTILGGAGAALVACPVAGAYLAAGEIAADAGGAAAGWAFGKDAGFSADNMVGGLARGMFGDRSWGEDLSNSLGGGVGGHIAGTVANVLASPVQGAYRIGEGVVNEIGAIGSGIWNGEGAIGGGIHAIGGGIADAAGAVGDFVSGW